MNKIDKFAMAMFRHYRNPDNLGITFDLRRLPSYAKMLTCRNMYRGLGTWSRFYARFIRPVLDRHLDEHLRANLRASEIEYANEFKLALISSNGLDRTADPHAESELN